MLLLFSLILYYPMCRDEVHIMHLKDLNKDLDYVDIGDNYKFSI